MFVEEIVYVCFGCNEFMLVLVVVFWISKIGVGFWLVDFIDLFVFVGDVFWCRGLVKMFNLVLRCVMSDLMVFFSCVSLRVELLIYW